LVIGVVVVIALLGYLPGFQATAVADLPSETENEPAKSAEPTEDLSELLSPTATQEPEPTLTAAPTETPTLEPTPTEVPLAGPFGPDPEDFPAGMSMLTGQMVSDPSTLNYPPAMVSITNWPVNARPQAGLGSASLVYELYIGDGGSRFLTLFYGDYPQPLASTNSNSADSAGEGGEENDDEATSGSSGVSVDYSNADSIGPIRSGRLPYESIRNLNNGFLVMASAYAGVAANLDQYTNVFGDNSGDINSAKIPVDQLKEIAASYEGSLVDGVLSGNVFDENVPSGGVPGDTFWFFYNRLNQIAWKYDPDTGAYFRYADQADGATYQRLVDGMTGETVDISNVILLSAFHRYCTFKAFDIDFYNMTSMPAVLFRDGQKYDIHWTTANTEFEIETGKRRPIRFIDDDGNPFPLKPGPTWIILAPMNTSVWESMGTEEIPLDSLTWIPEDADVQFYGLINKKLEGTGVWVSRFYQELMLYDATVCAKID
jgi:hypothetical protein